MQIKNKLKELQLTETEHVFDANGNRLFENSTGLSNLSHKSFTSFSYFCKKSLMQVRIN